MNKQVPRTLRTGHRFIGAEFVHVQYVYITSAKLDILIYSLELSMTCFRSGRNVRQCWLYSQEVDAPGSSPRYVTLKIPSVTVRYSKHAIHCVT